MAFMAAKEISPYFSRLYISARPTEREHFWLNKGEDVGRNWMTEFYGCNHKIF